MSEGEERYARERVRIEQGHVKYRDKLKAEGKLFVRDRLTLLLDPGTEDSTSCAATCAGGGKRCSAAP